MSRKGESTAHSGKLTMHSQFFYCFGHFQLAIQISDYDIGVTKCLYYIGVAIGAKHFCLPDFLQCRFPVVDQV